MARVPKGYRGQNHETLGSDIQSILKVLALPEAVLGREVTTRLRALDANAWYPIGMLLELLETIGEKLGSGTLINVGWALFKLSHEAQVKPKLHSVRDIVYGMDAMYHHANRGVDIGGWAVKSFEPGRAVLEKTTPHHCKLEEGILDEAIRGLKVPAIIKQTACFREGAECCEFLLTSYVTDERWGGKGSR